MINKIGLGYDSQISKISYSSNKITQNKNMQSPIQHDSKSMVYPKSYVTFGASPAETVKKMQEIKDASTPAGKEFLQTAENIAREYGSKTVNEKHIMLANIEKTVEFIEKTENSKNNKKLSSEDAGLYAQVFSPEIFQDAESKNALKLILIAKSDEIKADLESDAKKPLSEKTAVSYDKNIVNTAYEVYAQTKEQYAGKKIMLPASFMVSALMAMPETEGEGNYVTETLESIGAAYNEIMGVEETEAEEDATTELNIAEETIHLSAFDDKAKKILKNLSLGVNMFVLTDGGVKSDYLINSIDYVLNNSEDEKGKLNKDNTTLTVLENTNSSAIAKKAAELAQDESKTHIIVYNQDEIISSEANAETGMWSPSSDFVEMISNPPKNIKYVAIQQKETYYNDMKSSFMSDMYADFGDTSLPMLSPAQTKQAFREQPVLMEEIDKEFTKEALDKTIEAASLLDGEYPEKAQKLMKKLSVYYIDKPQITAEDVNAYMQEAKTLFKGASEDGKFQVIFDTGKNLDQFLGKEATKREAALIVKEMKANTLGTKGAIIYSADDTVGSGRRFTAQAIAGEAKAPYVEVNAMDFTIKVDATGRELYPDDDVKKMFSLLRAQAEANPDKSAVLYVENFEYFLAGDEMSSRYMNLMPIIQREMKAADAKGLNILVLGSVSDSKIAGSSLVQSSGFGDTISVDTPAFDIKARGQIADKALNDLNLQVAGNAQDRAEFLKYASEITEYFSFADMKSLMKKARSVSVERGHEALTKEDLVEGYLQLTTGRLAANNMPDYEKKLVASHECGHATNLEVMRNLALDTKIPWRAPEKVNFVTLDPRGYYGGAVYFSSKVENPEMSFEKMFADVVCSYGGHSAEKRFFDMDGSYGITCDLESATNSASQAVMTMGQGARTGKLSINGMPIGPSEEQKEIMRKDIEAIMDDALYISDEITKEYADFNEKFSEKYGPLVGTGACIILGEVFRKELDSWIKAQTPEKKAALKALDDKILEVISYAKKGLKYKASDLTREFCKAL